MGFDELGNPDGKVDQVLGSVVDNSYVREQSVVQDSVVSDRCFVISSTVKDSKVSGGTVRVSNVSDSCDVQGSMLANVKMSDHCKIASSYFATETESEKADKLVITRTKSLNGSVLAVGGGRIHGSELDHCHITFRGKEPLITSSTINDSRVLLNNAAGQQGKITLAIIQDESVIGTGAPPVGEEGIAGTQIIKGVSGKPPIFISYAHIQGSPVILATSKGSPQITGYKGQPAKVLGFAKVYDNAHVAGTVGENAEVFGDAQIMGQAVIVGDCKVGGTAVMVSGMFSTGEFMEGRHEGGDSFMDRVSAKIRSKMTGEDGED